MVTELKTTIPAGKMITILSDTKTILSHQLLSDEQADIIISISVAPKVENHSQ